jgi:hypothetical protein
MTFPHPLTTRTLKTQRLRPATPWRSAFRLALPLLLGTVSYGALTYDAVAQSVKPGAVAAPADPLVAGFQNPGEKARPRVWWHWMNGNITWEGAKQDMDWMKRVGIAGLQSFDAGQATQQVVEKRLPYMSEGWKQVFRNTAAYADAQGLELATAASPGWSETGGPWVTAEDAMKKMAWSATRVPGGKAFTGKLAVPPKTTGMLQTSTFGGILGGRAPGQNPPELYVDQKVVAFKVPADSALPTPKITTSAGPLGIAEAGALSDGDIQAKAIDLPAAKEVGGLSWVQWDYGKPVTVRGLTLSTPLWASWYHGLEPMLRNGTPPTGFRLEASDDGKTWSDTKALVQTGMPERTISVDEVRARYFRLVSIRQAARPPQPLKRFERPQGPIPEVIPFTELTLRGEPVVHSFEEKAAYTSNSLYYGLPSGTQGAVPAKPEAVVDLTSRMRPDGSLDWTPPAGDWMVLRIGYSLTGAMNRPASPEATGLEVDKMDAAAVKRYMDHYLGMYRDATDGKIGAHGLRAMMFDSWEASFANWTPAILADFKRLRGYDATPWLPALAGYVIDTPERSDAFLWDWRRTLQELLKVNHYEQLTDILHANGLIRYGEAHEEIYSTMGDGMEMKQSADIPMGAMWQAMTPGPVEVGYFTDLTESASVAHIYGQNITAAEALTGGPAFGSAPWNLKPTADMVLLAGVNRFVIHTSTHQPVDKGPGMTLGVGQFFTRNETWAEQAKPWVDYLSRSSFLLQQGQAVSDVAVFYGEAGPPIATDRDVLPEVPEGYRYDYVNADVILNKLSSDGDALTTTTGMRYRTLVFGRGVQRISLPVLRKLSELVNNGAVVVGARPQGSPSLADDPQAVKALLDTLWPGGSVATVGKGRVFASGNLAEALTAVGVAPDFSYAKPANDSKVMFIHRNMVDGDAYFLSNRNDRAEQIDTSFRVSGREPELWDPATGQSKPVSYRVENGRTSVSIPFDRFGSTFVVFRKPTTKSVAIVTAPTEVPVATITGPWQIKFQANRGAPESATFPELSDFKDNSDPGIRYFSGIATYVKDIQVPSKPGAKDKLWLDLGQVNDLAEVWVNGKLAGTVWKPPYRLEITAFAKQGTNRIEIKVVNKWVNRLIGDVQPGVTKKITFTGADGKVPEGMNPENFQRSKRMPYAPDAPLVPSGLVGPVTLIKSSMK